MQVGLFLFFISFLQLGFSNEVLFPNVLQQIAFGCIYLTIRLLAAYILKPILANVLVETITLVLFFHLLLAYAQVFGVFPVHYPGAIATGMFFNPGPFAIYTTALLLFVLVLSLVNIKTKKYGMAAVQAVLSIAAIWLVFTSHSRSAWIGLFMGFALVTLWIVIQNGQLNKVIKFKWFYSISIVLAFLIGIGIWKVYEMKKDSAEGRQLTWSAAILMAKEHPLLGVGTGNYAANNIQYQGEYFDKAGLDDPLAQLAGDSRYAFNDILQTAAE
jgi:O-antigen ligase